MYILGIVEGHNSSAALLKNGKLVAVCFEERFSRLKNDMGYPFRAVDYCLNEAGIQSSEIDHVALVTENLPLAQILTKREACFSVGDHLDEQEKYWYPRLIEKKNVNYFDVLSDKLKWNEFPYDVKPEDIEGRENFSFFKQVRIDNIKKRLNVRDDQIHIMHHHLAHSAYAIFTTPWCNDKPLLVLGADGYGDDCSASVGIFKNNKFEFISKSKDRGIGSIYRYVTLVLGMKPGVDEFKVMGLAPYASPWHIQKALPVFRQYLKVEGMEILNTNPDPDTYFSLKERLKAHRFDGIAGALQQFSEEISVEWVRNCIAETGIADVVISGGVSMNIKINKCIMEMPEVKSLFVGPSGGDETLSVGAAWALQHQLFPNDKIEPMETTYFGPGYGKSDNQVAIQKMIDPNLFDVIEDPSDDLVATHLANFKVIARSIGRMEYGARALGNRSIIARADDPGMIRKINSKIKLRDFWMPFAPMIMSERADDYIINPKKLPSPYMTIGFDSTDLARKHIKAGLHPADDSMRPQILEKHQNTRLYSLMKSFEAKTGFGGWLNTSFNLHGEPVCNTPEDSIRTLLNSDLDGLLLDGYLILRKD